jgi:uncharacterized MAPEG superfamily protein
MVWVQLVMLLAVIQLIAFGLIAGRSRSRFGIPAPAMTGNETFERYQRAHQNTIEMIIPFLTAIWVASIYWSPWLVAAIGAVYLVGRVIYFRAYTAGKPRTLGFGLSLLPTAVLILMSFLSIIRMLLG